VGRPLLWIGRLTVASSKHKQLLTWKPVGSLSALRGEMNGRFAPFCVSVDAHMYIAAAKRSGSELGGSLAVASCRLGCAVRSSAETAALHAKERARGAPAQ
jgi:hypothetical protein